MSRPFEPDEKAEEAMAECPRLQVAMLIQWAGVEDFLTAAALTSIIEWRPIVAKYLEISGTESYRYARDNVEATVEKLGLARGWNAIEERVEEIAEGLFFARQTCRESVPSPSAAREATMAAAGALLVGVQLKAAEVNNLLLPFARTSP